MREGGGELSGKGELLILFLRLKIRNINEWIFWKGRNILAKYNAERQHSNYNTVWLSFVFKCY